MGEAPLLAGFAVLAFVGALIFQSTWEALGIAVVLAVAVPGVMFLSAWLPGWRTKR